jgi:hypothetical protein
MTAEGEPAAPIRIGQRAVAPWAAAVQQPAYSSFALDAPTPAAHGPGAEVNISTRCLPRWYGGAEYLFWWVKGAPLSVPIVSTGPTSTKEGILMFPQSTILYGAAHPPAAGGNSRQDFPGISGLRLELGYRLDDDGRFAIEGSAFVFERRSAGFSAASDPNGNPGMRVVGHNIFGYTPGGTPAGHSPVAPSDIEDGLPISVPGSVSGNINITNHLRLWGAGATGVLSVYRDSTWQLSGLVGFRYLDLFESFDLTDNLFGVPGSMFDSQSGTVRDRFQTRNQFYGGTIGLRTRLTADSLYAELSGRVSVGATHDVLNIAGGFTAVNFPPPTSSGRQGIFAQPANEGRSSSNRLAVVPEVQFKVGYAIAPWLRTTVGYDFLAYSSVVRPGDQINRNLPFGQTFNQDPTSVSGTFPTRLFNTTNFYAHGLSLGIEFVY